MEMGFDEKEVIDALRVNNNQQDAAVSSNIISQAPSLHFPLIPRCVFLYFYHFSLILSILLYLSLSTFFLHSLPPLFSFLFYCPLSHSLAILFFLSAPSFVHSFMRSFCHNFFHSATARSHALSLSCALSLSLAPSRSLSLVESLKHSNHSHVYCCSASGCWETENHPQKSWTRELTQLVLYSKPS